MSSVTRVELKETSQNYGRFVIPSKDFSKQYSHLYVRRSNQMRAGLIALLKRRWGDDFPMAEKIIDTEANLEELKQDVALIGILYKEMSLRASVLDEFKESNGISQGVTERVDNYVSKDDLLILEDESGRVAIGGELTAHVNQLVSGIMVALRGSMGTDGRFHASEMLSMGMAGLNSVKPSKPMSLPPSKPVPSNPQATYVMLVSGLSIGGGNAKASLQLQLLMDFLCGRLGGDNDVALASRVARVIVCGNSVLSTEKLHVTSGAGGKEERSWSGAANKATAAKLAQENMAPIRELDTLLAQALMSVPIDLMPGSDDPGVFTLPQQPLHPCLLPQSTRFSSLSLVTNPYEVSLNGMLLTGHSGAPVADIARQTSINAQLAEQMQVDGAEELSDAQIATQARQVATKHYLQILQNTYKWGHMAPTAPDSLPCYPFASDRNGEALDDPFVLSAKRMPHVLFCGNAPGFATDAGTTLDGHTYRVISVPRFGETGTAVLLDLDSLDVSLLEFGVH